ncbi:DUF2062 domain-containing protein [uncultured Aquimarina sp.]|uniref:DUF2062 domain-containing protein n=1 Tax=uncultured Aquimarina sp. TaxID=575652 RepID=UPI002603DBC9|nr:DUF2062 domain-containing protein [uncultured Aquimarina sp.]
MINNIWHKLKIIFRQGLTPKQLAITITVGILISIFPVFGLTTIILTCIALPFKLNLPIMIVISYIVTPIKLLLLIPFINIGASVFGTEHTLLTVDAIRASYESNFFNTLKSLSYELLCGFVGWFLLAIPISILLYMLLKVFLKFLVKINTN